MKSEWLRYEDAEMARLEGKRVQCFLSSPSTWQDWKQDEQCVKSFCYRLAPEVSELQPVKDRTNMERIADALEAIAAWSKEVPNAKS
jgi:hypothetical protein